MGFVDLGRSFCVVGIFTELAAFLPDLWGGSNKVLRSSPQIREVLRSRYFIGGPLEYSEVLCPINVVL